VKENYLSVGLEPKFIINESESSKFLGPSSRRQNQLMSS